ncbi:2-dehydro-3-deoxygalactonokinase [Noviherbaspirillum aridicola]|uniref:MFS transporter n=1 Tax=Noviherbaspirillum aridicola TaxID=2849687 RepID=A0ABQ4Q300_9BURK|nr:2-dehydro-3-deoxygalactonokinase [Noviherbaspirillum aridicola]GIZ51230.1 MFS transporter [Noviherbaspirillum aridicola]
MSAEAPLLGIDWGTSNRRAYLLDRDGRLLRRHEDEGGILRVDGDFEGSLAALLRVLGLAGAEVVMSGMVGSRNGWQEAPYLDVAEPLSALGARMAEVGTALPGVRCRIVPGYRFLDPQNVPDVMRGEEAQLLGTLRLGADEGWFLLPGTHSKWARVEQGRIMEFYTFMTGELYALLSQHGTLSKVMDARQSVPEAFAAGMQAARHAPFTHAAFGCRALVVTDMMPAAHTASYLSGLLIGTELHDILRRAGGSLHAVQVIGSEALGKRYLEALQLAGIGARAWQPDEVYVAALGALFNIEE